MMKVRSIMTKDVVTASKDSSIMDVVKIMALKSVSSIIVVENKKPIALVSENDIIAGILSKKQKIRDIMSSKFMVVSPSTSFTDVSKILKDKKIKRFPVVENGELVGLVTETDLVEATRDFTRFHQIVQEIILAIFGLATAFFLFYFSPLKASLFG